MMLNECPDDFVVVQQRQQHARVQSGLTEQRVDGRAFVPFVLIHGARAEGVQGRNFGT